MVTATGLGVATPMSGHTRLRYLIAFPLAEAIMPLVGLFLGHTVKSIMGPWLFWVSGLLLLGLGGWMLYVDDDGALEAEGSRARVAVLALAVSIDELVAGFAWGLGMNHMLWLSLALGLQALAWTAIGLVFGRSLSRWMGEWAEKLGGGIIVMLGLYVLGSHFGIS